MSQLYVCKEYETPYEEGYRVIRTIEEHNKIIYNQALEDFEMKIKECCSVVGSCDFEDMAKIKEQLIK